MVQGPFQAALLAEFAVEIIGKPPQRFRHRGVRPLYEGSFSINAKVEADALHLWTADERGRLEKRTRDVAVLVLGSNTEDENGHTLLKNGADEYIAPPFSPAELLNRIHATLKNARCEEPADPICLSFADLSLDATTYRVERNGQAIHLGLKEFRLLQHLMKNPHRVHSRDELQSAVWPSDAQIGLRTVDVHIGRLRGALRSVGGPDLIRTVRSVGYSLTR